MFTIAIQDGAVRANPVRDAAVVKGARPTRTAPRALTATEVGKLTAYLRSAPKAVELDVADVADWMLATGCRIGEALALRFGTGQEGGPLLDLEARTWELATDHVVLAGRRQVAHVTGPRASRAVVQRVDGVRAALRRHGLRLAAPVLYGPWSQRRAYEVVGRLLADRPQLDAVVCGSDQLASGAVAALVDAGRQVPGDVAVTGFDNWLEFAADSSPELTSVDMNLTALGAAAARELLSGRDAPGVGSGVRRHPCSLVVRGSTDPLT